MPLQVKIITSSSDYPALAAIKWEAFKDNDLNQLMYPASIEPETLQAWFVEREKREAANPFQRIVAVIDADQNDEMVAYAKWKLPRVLFGKGEGEMEEVELVPVPKVPDGAREEIWKMFRGGVEGMREKWGDVREVFELHSLATHPLHQSRGAASLLLKWGTDQADAAGKKCYLESTPMAFPLYMKHGWVKIDEVVIDLERFGGEREIVAVMMREPRRD